MYYQANDQELLYLIKDGNQQAYQALYSKYEHLIAKLYKNCSHYKKAVYDDFKQECLMCLEKAIHSYQDKYNCSFYSFFLLLIQRNASKLFRKNSLFLQEKNVCYATQDTFIAQTQDSKLINYVIQSLDLKNKLEEDLFYECILKNQKVILIARQYGMPYPTVYLKYKKIKEKVEKLLTNLLV